MLTTPDLPLLTADIPGTGGVIKSCPEDFLVEELPIYQPSGQGTHVYALMEKIGISTPQATSRIAHFLNIHPRQIGYAGLKDARALTRQWISIEHIEPEKLQELDIPDVRICRLERHGNKIKIGHLAANRFVIRLRQLAVPMETALSSANEIMQILIRRGVPNYYGPQRFGVRADSHLLGMALIKSQPQSFLDIFLGSPTPSDPPAATAARDLYDQGDYQQACQGWPNSDRNRQRALQALIKPNATPARAVRAVDRQIKSFLISAAQSSLFNQVLAARMPNIDQLLAGDLAYKHPSGACFIVEDPLVEQPRCDALAISPTGPIFGYRLKFPDAQPGQIERDVLERAGLTLEQFRSFGQRPVKGVRRPLRFQPRNCQITDGTDDLGPYMQLQFELNSGCYATTLLQEITTP